MHFTLNIDHPLRLNNLLFMIDSPVLPAVGSIINIPIKNNMGDSDTMEIKITKILFNCHSAKPLNILENNFEYKTDVDEIVVYGMVN